MSAAFVNTLLLLISIAGDTLGGQLGHEKYNSDTNPTPLKYICPQATKDALFSVMANDTHDSFLSWDDAENICARILTLVEPSPSVYERHDDVQYMLVSKKFDDRLPVNMRKRRMDVFLKQRVESVIINHVPYDAEETTTSTFSAYNELTAYECNLKYPIIEDGKPKDLFKSIFIMDGCVDINNRLKGVFLFQAKKQDLLELSDLVIYDPEMELIAVAVSDRNVNHLIWNIQTQKSKYEYQQGLMPGDYLKDGNNFTEESYSDDLESIESTDSTISSLSFPSSPESFITE